MTVPRHSLSNYVSYHFDRYLSRGAGFLLILLAAFSVSFLAIFSFFMGVAMQVDGLRETPHYLELFWSAFNTALDPAGVDDPGWAYRLTMVVVALFGLTVVGTLIGIITTGISEKIEDLRRGRSRILEKNHTLILGWSSKVIDAVREIVVANESRRKGVVVIMSTRNKTELEDNLRLHLPSRGNTEIICRCGDPSDIADLALVQPSRARSVLLFAEGDGMSADAVTLKRAMAIKKRFEVTGFRQPIIAEVTDRSVAAAARALGDIHIVHPVSTVTRILLQAARQPGLSHVYSEVLSFTGCEIYFQQFSGLAGLSYADAVLSAESSSVLGIFSEKGHKLNPPADTVLEKDDKLILIARDDSEIGGFNPTCYAETSADAFRLPSPQAIPEKYVIFGWHEGTYLLLQELDQTLANGSQVNLFYDPNYTSGASFDFNTFQNIAVDSTLVRAGCEEDIRSVDFSGVSEFVIVSYRDTLGPQEADSLSLITLIHLRGLTSASPNCRIATELLDSNNRKLALCERDEDFIASDELISDLMAQLSENPGLAPVFKELMTAEGCEFHLKTAEEFGINGEATPYRDLVVRGLQNGITVVGYFCRRTGQELVQNLAPHKDETVILGKEDRIIVLAE